MLNGRGVAMCRMKCWLVVMGLTIMLSPFSAAAQSISGVRGLGGGVAPLFGLVGPGNLYVDSQGTAGLHL